MRLSSRLSLVIAYAVAMAFVEAAVVVYLRALYYPEGFSITLRSLSEHHLQIEVIREFATVVMITAVALLAGRRGWERFGYFLVIAGLWDIFYYIWLKAVSGWPASLTDWDILFLIPTIWVGPVIAPMLVALTMVAIGIAIARKYGRGQLFRARLVSWILALAGTGVILYTFMRDADAINQQQPARPYLYPLLALGLVLYVGSYLLSSRRR